MSGNTSEIYTTSQNHKNIESSITSDSSNNPAAIITISDEGRNQLENLSNSNSQQIEQLGQTSDSKVINSKGELTQTLIDGTLTALSNQSVSFTKTNSASTYVGNNYAGGSVGGSYKSYSADSVEMSLDHTESVKANFSFAEDAPYKDNTSTRSTTGDFTIEDNQTSLTHSESVEKIQSETFNEQNLNFNAHMIVQTSSGKASSIGLSVNVSREFYEKLDGTDSIKFEKTMQKLVDPLVINFDASSAELSNVKFSFDLDCDGTSDQISRLSKGSGFLALDKNNDGQINDGSELFGTKSGDGFADLASYDTDKNGWIDSGDEIYDKLRIWTMDEKGNNQLVGLGEKGIGAVYLGNVNTDYSLKSSDNELNGMIRQTGVFLRENFTAGTIQHVDFALDKNSSGLNTSPRENFTENSLKTVDNEPNKTKNILSKTTINMPQNIGSIEQHINIELQTNNYQSIRLSNTNVKSTWQTQENMSDDTSKELKNFLEETKMQIEQFKRILAKLNFQKKHVDMTLQGGSKLYAINQLTYNYSEDKNSVLDKYIKFMEDNE
ncbi:hypothetical protein [Clostridium gelidum]|nr:hypothetical protein [Clostridium gelidum]